MDLASPLDFFSRGGAEHVDRAMGRLKNPEVFLWGVEADGGAYASVAGVDVAGFFFVVLLGEIGARTGADVDLGGADECSVAGVFEVRPFERVVEGCYVGRGGEVWHRCASISVHGGRLGVFDELLLVFGCI